MVELGIKKDEDQDIVINQEVEKNKKQEQLITDQVLKDEEHDKLILELKKQIADLEKGISVQKQKMIYWKKELMIYLLINLVES